MRHLTHLKYIDVVAKEKSIRKASEKLSITSTALNRRIIALENEIGTPIFERLPSGVRLNTAGELLIQHVRFQIKDLSRVLSQIADLSGNRRGHVNITCNSTTIGNFLSFQIAKYRSNFPEVTFDIKRSNTDNSLKSLKNFEADIAIVFDSVLPSDVQIISSTNQNLYLLLNINHPLIDYEKIKLQQCIEFPLILHNEMEGIKNLINIWELKNSYKFKHIITTDSNEFMINYSQYENSISFHLPISFSRDTKNLKYQLIDEKDAIKGSLHIIQSKGRVLPVAAAKFVDQMLVDLNKNFPNETR